MFLEEKGHTVPHWKALSIGKYDPRRLNCGSTLNICQDVLKSANLLQQQGFDDSESSLTVSKKDSLESDNPFSRIRIFLF